MLLQHKSKHQYGADNPQYKGGCVDKNGYRVISCRRNGKRVQDFEHRIVMAEMIGRELDDKETVHHKNGNRLDNRPENLELWSTRNPKGQRIEDKMQYVDEMITRYGVPVSSGAFVSGLLGMCG